MEMERLYDAVIIGGGPAGLTASLYLARAGYRVLVMEENNFGGQPQGGYNNFQTPPPTRRTADTF